MSAKAIMIVEAKDSYNYNMSSLSGMYPSERAVLSFDETTKIVGGKMLDIYGSEAGMALVVRLHSGLADRQETTDVEKLFIDTIKQLVPGMNFERVKYAHYPDHTFTTPPFGKLFELWLERNQVMRIHNSTSEVQLA